MNTFGYRDESLFCEGVDVNVIAEQVGTPVFVYGAATIVNNLKSVQEAWASVPHLVCYAVKANSNIAILRLLGEQGAGMEVVSGGELFRSLSAGIDPQKIVFTGVGKTVAEMEYALEENILLFVVESLPELLRLNEVAARLGKRASFAVRLNPNVDPHTHSHITTGKATNKFGIDRDSALEAYRQSKDMGNVSAVGLHMHIGSQILSIKPFLAAVQKAVSLIHRIRDLGIDLQYVDLGGGAGIAYEAGQIPLAAEELAGEILPLIQDLNVTVIVEPGRSIVGDAGALVTTVQYLKETPEKTFVVVDAGMNDLLRPALYDAYHRILSTRNASPELIEADVVGPLCESGDTFAKDRRLHRVDSGDRLAIMSAGAYAFSMSSEYNSRPKCAEVLVRDDEFFIIRERAKAADLIVNEKIPGFLSEAPSAAPSGDQ